MNLSTAEKFLLIGHHPEKGRFLIAGFQLEYGLIGAILLDMTLENMIITENERLIVKKSVMSNNQLFNEISSLIFNAKKPQKIKYWIIRLARQSRKYRWMLLTELTNKRFIRIENRKFLGIIPYRKSFLTGSYTRNNLIQQLKSNVLFHKELNNETVVILGMIEACKMHRIITSDKDELKTIRKELKQVIKESPIAGTVNETIKQVQAAIIGAVIATSAASSAAAHH
jgi:hypothetical protein